MIVFEIVVCTEIALQSHSGLFQFLPLGLRVQEKIEKLLDKHMLKLGSSDCHSGRNNRVTNVSFRCIKAFIVNILV